MYAKGNAPYNGPAWRVASNITSPVPFHPDSLPICFSILSRGTQTSNKPISMNINGRNSIISLKNIQKFIPIFSPAAKSNIYDNPIRIKKTNRKIYFFTFFIKRIP